jgi:hypothetical protein
VRKLELDELRFGDGLCRHCEKRSDEAIQGNAGSPCLALDCFAEPVIRRRYAPTGWLAMTEFVISI